MSSLFNKEDEDKLLPPEPPADQYVCGCVLEGSRRGLGSLSALSFPSFLAGSLSTDGLELCPHFSPGERIAVEGSLVLSFPHAKPSYPPPPSMGAWVELPELPQWSDLLHAQARMYPAGSLKSRWHNMLGNQDSRRSLMQRGQGVSYGLGLPPTLPLCPATHTLAVL